MKVVSNKDGVVVEVEIEDSRNLSERLKELIGLENLEKLIYEEK